MNGGRPAPTQRVSAGEKTGNRPITPPEGTERPTPDCPRCGLPPGESGWVCRCAAKGGRPASRRAVREIVTDLDLEAKRCRMRCDRCLGIIAPGIDHQCQRRSA